MADIIGIYHKNCLDGTTAAAVLLKKFPAIKLFPVSHSAKSDSGDVPEDLSVALEAINEDSIVYFVDIAVGAEHIIKVAKEVVVIDHHIGINKKLQALAEKHDNFKYVFDNNKSGASLTWIHFFGDSEIPKIILYVEDSDIWRFTYGDETRFAVSYLYNYSGNPEAILAFVEKGEPALASILSNGKTLFEYREWLANTLIEHVEPIYIRIDKHRVPIHNAPEFLRSEIGHELAKKFGRAVATFVINGDSVRLHFRGEDKNNPSALELAKMLGGGGHRNAAGAYAPLKKFCEMIVYENHESQNT